MATRGPQNGRRGLESGLPLCFWVFPSTLLLLNMFFDPSTPSMRKGDDGDKKIKIVATNVDKKFSTPFVENDNFFDMTYVQVEF